MKRYNVIIVYNKSEDKILMCYRKKEPYMGLYNLVGGKIEDSENDLESAYRELFEETGITKADIDLKYLMNSFYKMSDTELQTYVGILNKEFIVTEEINTLHWINVSSNFFDMNKFAGEGNIGHMIEQVKIHYNKLFDKEKQGIK